MQVLLFFVFFSVNSVIFTKSVYKAYVINLPHRTNRLERIAKQLDNYDIPYEVFPAIAPIDLENEKKLRSNNETSDRFDPATLFDFVADYSAPRPSEVGCHLSHVQVLLKIANSNSDAPALILEDDAAFESNFYNRTINIMNKVEGKWDILHVGYCHRADNKCDPKGDRGHEYCKMINQHLPCAQAYFINGSKSAKTILKHVNTAKPQYYDFVLGFATDKYYISLPKLARQIPFPSDNGNPIGHWYGRN